MPKATPNIFVAWLIAAISVVAASCSAPESQPGQFLAVPDAGWEYGDTLRYDVPTLATRDIALTIRHADLYPYANLWIEVTYPSDDSIIADTMNINIADPYGKWLGAGSGPSIMRTDTIRLTHTPDTASTLGIRHIMRVDRLPSIEQIGVTFVSQTK